MQQTQSAEPAFFQDPKPAAIRLWHWLAALFFFFSLTTVFFGSVLFEARDNVGLVQESVSQKGGMVTEDQARWVAHGFSDKIWMLHKYIGFGLCALLLWRIVAEVGMSREKTLRARIRQGLSLTTGTPDKKHIMLVQYGYIVFYAIFITMATTGLILAFEDVAFFKAIRRDVKEVHEFCQWGMYAYILFHLAGVIRSDLTRYPGIVSRMINGKAAGRKVEG